MNKTLVAVSNSIVSEYVQKQLEAISESFPELAIEHVNETNSIMQRFARYPDRLPAFFILKNDSRMAVLQAKVSTEELINWVKSTSG
jgi:hypothetical protein